MNKPSKNNIGKWGAALCLWLLCAQNQAAQFVEISAEIETFGYRLGDTNSMAKAKPKLVSVDCITGSSEWFIENDFQERQEWLFDGTTVVCRSRPLSAGSGVLLCPSGGCRLLRLGVAK